MLIISLCCTYKLCREDRIGSLFIGKTVYLLPGSSREESRAWEGKRDKGTRDIKNVCVFYSYKTIKSEHVTGKPDLENMCISLDPGIGLPCWQV